MGGRGVEHNFVIYLLTCFLKRVFILLGILTDVFVMVKAIPQSV